MCSDQLDYPIIRIVFIALVKEIFIFWKAPPGKISFIIFLEAR